MQIKLSTAMPGPRGLQFATNVVDLPFVPTVGMAYMNST